MDSSRINIAIAGAVGINLDHYRSDEGIVNVATLPNYCGDLNAMRVAEDTLSDPQQMLMYNWLEEICERHGKFPGGVDVRLATRVWRAAPAHRAEAFLRTIDKWEDSK